MTIITNRPQAVKQQPFTVEDQIALALNPAELEVDFSAIENKTVYDTELQAFIDAQNPASKTPAWVTRAINGYATVSILTAVATSVAINIEGYIRGYNSLAGILAIIALVLVGNLLILNLWGQYRKNSVYPSASVHDAGLRLFTAKFQPKSGTDIAGRLSYIALFGFIIYQTTAFALIVNSVTVFVIANFALVLAYFAVEAIVSKGRKLEASKTYCP